MNSSLKPIYLFADSQLLFWRDNGTLFLDSIRGLIGAHSSKPVYKAAYIGASNRDNPDYYPIFRTAMEGIGVDDCRMILSAFSEADAAFLNEADVILLAGGDVEEGWNVIKQNGVREAVIKKYYEGAVLIGVSAGAVQLGLFGWSEPASSLANLIDTFKLVPFILGVHDEKQQWLQLQQGVRLMKGSVQGLGIPSGGGLLYYADQIVEPIRYPVYEISFHDEKVTQNLLVPRGNEDIEQARLIC